MKELNKKTAILVHGGKNDFSGLVGETRKQLRELGEEAGDKLVAIGNKIRGKMDEGLNAVSKALSRKSTVTVTATPEPTPSVAPYVHVECDDCTVHVSADGTVKVD